MNQSERDDLLIRIDQKVINIEKSIYGEPKCSTMKAKVQLHDKVFWVALSASIVAVVKSFWNGV